MLFNHIDIWLGIFIDESAAAATGSSCWDAKIGALTATTIGGTVGSTACEVQDLVLVKH